nr:BTB domain containing protein [Pandoravirus belohorizontensis]
MDSATADSVDGAESAPRSAAAPILVVLNARGTHMSTTATTLANAPAGSLLHRIGAATRACDFGAPSRQADGSHFVDVNPLWLSVVIDYLAHGVVTAPKMTPGVLAGVQAAADYLGLDTLTLECAARLARIEGADAPPDHTIKVRLVTADDLHAHVGALDVFSRHRRKGADSPLTIALLRHHPMKVVGHILCEVLGLAPTDTVFYACWMRRNTTLRPLAPLDMTAPTPLGDCWAECSRVIWLYAMKREPPVDLVPVASCWPPIRKAPPGVDVPVLIFVKVFDPANRYLSGPWHAFVASDATVASALPTLLKAVDGSAHPIRNDDGVAVYEEVDNTKVRRVDMEGTFAQAGIETGDILWLCPRASKLGLRIALADCDWIVSPGGPRW